MLGLGHVGLTLGLTFAEAGFTVLGYDINSTVREKLKAGNAHFSERGLDDLLAKHLGNAFQIVEGFSDDTTCDVYVVTVGTPLDAQIRPDFSYIRSAAEDLGKCVKKGDLIILRSTVPLGTTREVFLPLMRKGSGLGEHDVHVAFAPERTIEGNALEELRTLPQVVGGLDEASTELAGEIFSTLTDTVVKLPSLEEAEIVKLINNAYRETVFSFANEVSLVAKQWGLNTKRVIKAANEGYSRSTIPFPSPGVGGYCLTKDGFLLSTSAEAKGLKLQIIPQTRNVSSTMLHTVAEELRSFVATHRPYAHAPRIAILGFAFKGNPATSDMRGSMSVTLVKRLKTMRQKFELVGYDPLVPKERIEELGVHAADSIEDAVAGSDVVIIMNNHEHFRTLSGLHLADGSKGPVLLYDTWGLHDPADFSDLSHIEYRTL
ncbi:MAG: hypothetical protein JWL82_452 [Parcubacteria group bacterium]|nr:hypothetical protein [Parcubacteria group bacterium]